MENKNETDLEKLFTWKPFPREIGLIIALQALKILHFSHTQGKGHGAFESHAILVSKNGMVKVTGSGVKGSPSDPLSLPTGGLPDISPAYLSPEVAKRIEKTDLTSAPCPIKGLSDKKTDFFEKNAEFENKDISRDLWSAGVLLYRILCGKLPFFGETVPRLLESIIYSQEQHFLHCIPFLPDNFAVAVSACLVKEPENRLSSLEPLITSLDVLISDMGIRDYEKEIQRYMADKDAATSELEKVLLRYHTQMTEKFRKSGDSVKAEAHFAEVERLGKNGKGVLQEVFILPADSPAKKLATGLFIRDKAVLPKKKPFFLVPRIAWIMFTASIIIVVCISFGTYFTIRQKTRVMSEVRAAYLQKTTATEPQAPTALGVMAKPARVVPQNAARVGVAKALPVRPAQPVRRNDTKHNPVSIGKRATPENNRVDRPETVMFASLKVMMEPSGAVMSLDGKKVTTQDMAKGMRVVSGSHVIDAWASGYKSYRKNLFLEPGVTQTFAISLARIEKGVGHIHVYSYPWANLYVNGEWSGTSPTPKPLELPEGEYTLLLQHPGFKPYSRGIRIVKGQVVKVQIELERVVARR